MSNPEQYIHSPLNRSVSKYAHAFPKAHRFQKPRHLITEAKYTLPSTFQKRSCSFGFGKKSDFVIKRCSPPPGSYDSQSDFNKGAKKQISSSFGMSRDTILFGSYLDEARKRAEQMPGPHRYDIKLPRNHVGGNMGLRIQSQPAAKDRHFPGPGAYNTKTIEMGNCSSFILSKYKNPTSPKYHESKTIDVKYFRNTRKAKFYEVQEKEFGKSRVSRYKNVSIATFGREKKLPEIDKWKLKVPGFKYNVFSEFGTSKR